MAGTFKTVEKFESGISKERMDEEIRLRLKAGAINSTYTGSQTDGWTLTTEWNVLGEQ